MPTSGLGEEEHSPKAGSTAGWKTCQILVKNVCAASSLGRGTGELCWFQSCGTASKIQLLGKERGEGVGAKGAVINPLVPSGTNVDAGVKGEALCSLPPPSAWKPPGQRLRGADHSQPPGWCLWLLDPPITSTIFLQSIFLQAGVVDVPQVKPSQTPHCASKAVKPRGERPDVALCAQAEADPREDALLSCQCLGDALWVLSQLCTTQLGPILGQAGDSHVEFVLEKPL